MADEEDNGYFDPETGLRIGSGGIGSATNYKVPPGVNTSNPYVPADAVRSDVANSRYQAARGAAMDLQAMRERNAQSDMPPGSPTQYLDRGGAPLGPIQRDEFNIPKPAPLAATGLRGYPGTDEINAAWAAKNASDKADADQQDVYRAVGSYSAAPKFQMPTTDQLIDTGIAARRSQLENEINTRKVHLGLLPPSAIGASATTLDSERPAVTSIGRHGQVRYGGSQADQTRAELAVLSRAAGQLDEAQQSNIKNNAALAIASAKQNEIAAQDTARAQVVHFMSNIDDSRYPHGSPDREAFIGKVFGSRPDWLHVMAKDKDLSKFVQDHVEAQNSVGATLNALKQQYPDTQFTPSVTSKGAVSYRGSISPQSKDETNLAALLHKQTGLTPDEFAAIDPSNVKAGGVFVSGGKPGEGTFHEGEGGFNLNGTPKGEFSNDFTKVIEGYKPGGTLTAEQQKTAQDRIAGGGAIQIDTGKGYKTVIPRTLFERYQSQFGNSEAPSSSGKKVISVEDWLNQ